MCWEKKGKRYCYKDIGSLVMKNLDQKSENSDKFHKHDVIIELRRNDLGLYFKMILEKMTSVNLSWKRSPAEDMLGGDYNDQVGKHNVCTCRPGEALKQKRM